MANEVWGKTKEYLSRLAGTATGQKLLTRYDQEIGFEVVGGERFVVSVKGGELSFRLGEGGVPAANLEEFLQNIKLIADSETFFALYNGELRPVDALIPEWEAPVRLNIYPYLPKLPQVSWICDIIKLIARQNKETASRR